MDDDMFGPDDFAQFFGGSGGPQFHQEPRQSQNRTEDADITIDVTLEELYKGKVFKMNSVRDVLCKSCSGKGGKPKAKERKCTSCDGKGSRIGMRRVGAGMVTKSLVPCETCDSKGFVYRDKDRCKRCHGSGVQDEKSVLEVLVPKGAKHGEKIVLQGKADEAYGKKTGDLIFTVNCADHDTFVRRKDDLYVNCKITLAEALCGFQRVLFTHLDGRGIQVTSAPGKVLRPGDYLKLRGEGMPVERFDLHGSMYILLEIEFPEDGWCVEKGELRVIQDMLPTQPPKVDATAEIDDVDYQVQHGDLPEYDDDEDEENGNGAYGQPDCSTM